MRSMRQVLFGTLVAEGGFAWGLRALQMSGSAHDCMVALKSAGEVLLKTANAYAESSGDDHDKYDDTEQFHKDSLKKLRDVVSLCRPHGTVGDGTVGEWLQACDHKKIHHPDDGLNETVAMRIISRT